MNMIKHLIEKRKRTVNTVEFWRGKGAKIGSGCSIHPSAELGSEPYLITIGNDVRLNSGVTCVTHDGGCWVPRRLYSEWSDADLFGQIKIGNNVHIGTNSVIMPGVCIGNNVIVGCGAVVTKNIPDNSIAVGVPARIIETIDEFVQKHCEDFVHTKSFDPDRKREFLRNKYGL